MSVFSLLSCSDIESNLNSGTGTSTDGGGGGGANKVFTLSWAAPTNFENADLLTPADDLSEYRIYYGDSEGNVTLNFTSISVDKTSFSTQSFDANLVSSFATVYLAMTSVSNDGVESVLSDIVTFNP